MSGFGEYGNAVGLVGAALYIVAYVFLQTGRLASRSPRYLLLHMSAGLLVLVGLAAHFNLASAVIQVCYICISLYWLNFAVRGRVRAIWRARTFARHLLMAVDELGAPSR